MRYQGYKVQLHSIQISAVQHLSDKLDYVDAIQGQDKLPDPSIMLRQLGKWSQEFFSPRKWKDSEKLIFQYDQEAAQIAVYFGSLLNPQLTITYDSQTQK